MAVATATAGSGVCPIGQGGTAASRISVSKTRQSFNGTPIPDSTVRSITSGLRLAYPVECNVTNV